MRRCQGGQAALRNRSGEAVFIEDGNGAAVTPDVALLPKLAENDADRFSIAAD